MDRRNATPRRWGLWTLSDLFDIAIIAAAVAVVLTGWAAMARAQDALDISILAKLDAPAAAPVTAKSADAEDVQWMVKTGQIWAISDVPGFVADELDLSIFDKLN